MIINNCISNNKGNCTDSFTCTEQCHGACEHYDERKIPEYKPIIHNEFDSYTLLKKYMKHIHNNTSVYYLDEGYDSFYSDAIQDLFTKKEWEELRRISKEIQ